MGKRETEKCEVCSRAAVVSCGKPEGRRRFCLSYVPYSVLSLAMMHSGGDKLRREVSMTVHVEEWIEQERQLLLAARGG